MSDEEKVREAALKILDYQDRTSSELREKLEKKGFDSELVQSVVRSFEESGLVDDTRYARLYIQSKIGAGKGRIWIKQKLRAKGVAAETADEAFDEFGTELDESVLCMQKALSICGLAQRFEVGEDGYIYPLAEDDTESVNFFSSGISEGETDRNTIYKAREKLRNRLTRRLITAGFPAGIVFDTVKKIDEL